MAGDTMRQWLAALGTLCAGNMPAEEAKIRVDAYAALMAGEFPPWAFDRRSLAAVARQCKWWPAYGELVELLSAWCRENKPASAAPRVEAPRELTPSEREAREDAADREWWLRRIDGWGEVAPDARWLNAQAALAQVTQPGSLPRPWLVDALERAAAQAEARGADTAQAVPEPRPYRAVGGDRQREPMRGLRPVAEVVA